MQFTPEQVQELLNGQIKLLDVLSRRRQALANLQAGLPKSEAEAASSPIFDFLPCHVVGEYIQTHIEALDLEISDRQKAVDQMKVDITALQSRVVTPTILGSAPPRRFA